MNFELTPELLAGIVAVVISLAMNYIPKLNTWFAGLATAAKSGIMALLLAITSVVIYGGGCLGWFMSNITCDQSGIFKLVSIFIAALIANQGAYVISPQTDAVREVKSLR